jgi:protein-tyrosine phosphatase
MSERGAGNGQILVVCAANVCRSPLARFLLGRELTASGRVDWQVTSAGVTASEGAEMCAASAASLLRSPTGRYFAEQHRSHLLTASDLAHADLVLVTSQDVRAKVTALDAGTRDRTFTLVEAAGLAERAGAEEPGSTGTVAEVAEAMRSYRGQLVPARSSWRQRLLGAHDRAVMGVDIGDAHTGEVRRHGDVVDAVTRFSTELVGSLLRLAQPSS